MTKPADLTLSVTRPPLKWTTVECFSQTRLQTMERAMYDQPDPKAERSYGLKASSEGHSA